MGSLHEIGTPQQLQHIETVIMGAQVRRQTMGPATNYTDLLFREGTREFEAAMGRLKDRTFTKLCSASVVLVSAEIRCRSWVCVPQPKPPPRHLSDRA